MEILSNLLLTSERVVASRDLLTGGGYSTDDAEKTVRATGFEFLSRFLDPSFERLIEYALPDLQQQIEPFRNEIAVVIVVTQTNIQSIPNGASILQAALKLSQSVLCIEIVEGCNGFVKGLYLANRLLGSSGLAIIFSGDFNSIMVENSPPGTAALFGDGFASTVVRKQEPFASEIFQNGSVGSSIRFKDSSEGLHMDGVAVYGFTSRSVPALVAGGPSLAFSDCEFPVFHQASKLIVEHLQHRLGSLQVPFTAFNAGNIGNLGPASIPGWMAVQEKIDAGVKMVCLGYGAGLSWGYATSTWAGGLNRSVRLSM